MTKLLSQFLSEPSEVIAAFTYLGVLTNAIKEVKIAKLSLTRKNSSNSTTNKTRKKK